MENEKILLLVDDLMFASRLENLVRQAGYTPVFATEAAVLNAALVQAPIMVIVDIFGQTFNWEPLVRRVKGPGKAHHFMPVLGFGPHTDLVLRQRALAAGCGVVVARSAIVQKLPQLIAKYRFRPDSAYCNQTAPPLVKQGIDEFNQGRFYDCHETLEDAWNAEAGQVRLLYQGILQIGVGYFHITQHNWRGAKKVLERGVPKAAFFRPTCQGIDVAGLVRDAQQVYTRLVAGGPDGIGDLAQATFPTIRFES